MAPDRGARPGGELRRSRPWEGRPVSERRISGLPLAEAGHGDATTPSRHVRAHLRFSYFQLEVGENAGRRRNVLSPCLEPANACTPVRAHLGLSHFQLGGARGETR